MTDAERLAAKLERMTRETGLVLTHAELLEAFYPSLRGLQSGSSR